MPTVPPAPSSPYLIRCLHIASGVVAIVGIWALASRLVALLHLPVAGGVVGLALLALLLLSGRVPPELFRPGAQWLVAELLLFLIPAVVSIVHYGSLLRHDGLQLAAISVTGTVLVMVVTGVVVEFVSRFETRAERRRRLTTYRAEAPFRSDATAEDIVQHKPSKPIRTASES
jgi:holin-like protein